MCVELHLKCIFGNHGFCSQHSRIVFLNNNIQVNALMFMVCICLKNHASSIYLLFVCSDILGTGLEVGFESGINLDWIQWREFQRFCKE